MSKVRVLDQGHFFVFGGGVSADGSKDVSHEPTPHEIMNLANVRFSRTAEDPRKTCGRPAEDLRGRREFYEHSCEE